MSILLRQVVRGVMLDVYVRYVGRCILLINRRVSFGF